MHGHAHDHPHDQVHDYARYAHTQHVVLDIGDDVGALVVNTPHELLGLEIEISPAGEDDCRSHKQVLKRTAGSSSEHVLVFDALPEGEYTLWLDGVARSRNVEVRGGEIAEFDWRAEAAVPRAR